MKETSRGEAALRFRQWSGRVGRRLRQMAVASLPMILSGALILVWIGVLYKAAAPRASEMAMMVAGGQVERVITAAAVDALEELTDIRYSEVSKGSDGTILSVSADAVAVAGAERRVLDAASASLEKLRYLTVRLPVGTLVGGELLSGRGFGIRYRAEPYCRLSAATKSTLESAGINQVCHRIALVITADVTLICMGRTDHFTVDVELPLSEALLVGRVPDGFFAGSVQS